VFTLLLAQGGEFAFVVFQAAAGAAVFDAATASLLIGAVAVSMLLSPLLLVAIDRFVLVRFTRGSGRSLDEISEQQQTPVIIAGFGRYGQIVGRLMLAQGVRATVLDHDADMVEAIRVFGYKVFYGDATRLDLLRMAGAEKARILVVAVDDPAQSLRHRRPGARALPAPATGGARQGRDALERAARPQRDARRARAVRVQPAQRPHRAGTAGPATARGAPAGDALSPAQPGAVRADVPEPQGPLQADLGSQAGPSPTRGADGPRTRGSRRPPQGRPGPGWDQGTNPD
jgi:hypothetical protein